MASVKTRGIVLRRRAYGEADRVLTILTPGMGKISAIAKGVRRLTSKLAGHVELFYAVDWVLAEGRTWYVVSGADVAEPHRHLRDSLARVEQASYLARLVDRLAPEHEPQPKLYAILAEALAALGGSGPHLLRQVEWQVLLASGLQPELRACSHCGNPLDPAELALCPSRGGALCPDCRKTEALHIPIHADTLKILRLYERAPLGLAARLSPSDATQHELARVTAAFLGHALESPLVLPPSAMLEPTFQPTA